MFVYKDWDLEVISGSPLNGQATETVVDHQETFNRINMVAEGVIPKYRCREI